MITTRRFVISQDSADLIAWSVHGTKEGINKLTAVAVLPPKSIADEVRAVINSFKSVQNIDPLFMFKNNKLSIQMGIWVALLHNN
jgi:hypothetical protein